MKSILKKTKKIFVYVSLLLAVVILVAEVICKVNLMNVTIYSLGIIIACAYIMIKEPKMFIGKRSKK